MASRFASINGIVLHHRLDGAADRAPVVLLNSLGSDLRIWDGVVARLAERFRVLRYDMRGHGLSGLPEGEVSIAELADDLLGLMSAVGFERAALVGLSVGGLVAQEIAIRVPERVSALVLMDTAARIGTRDGWNERIRTVEQGGVAVIAEAVAARWFGTAFRREQPEAAAGWQTMLARTPAQGYIAVCAALREADLRHAVGGIRAPTLALVGSEDAATTPEDVRDTAGRIPGARFAEVEGAGHLPCIDAADTVAGLIADHLRETGLG